MIRNWLTQIVAILAISTGLALLVNAARPGGISLIGRWPTHMSDKDGPVQPPSAQEGDPPFITLEEAATKYQSPDVIFIDARSTEDYAYGHISRAINIPFDYLDARLEASIDSLDRRNGYVVYCGGDECETSLFLGRYMTGLGFPNVSIFFGGWREWETNGLPVTKPASGGGEASQ